VREALIETSLSSNTASYARGLECPCRWCLR